MTGSQLSVLIRVVRKAKSLLLLVFSSLLFFGVKVGVRAQEDKASQGIAAPDYIMPPYPGDGSTFLGQDHNYSVTFRGNGEAVVSLKVIFTNKDDKALSALDLRIPKVEPKELAVYQVIREPVCIRYRTPQYDPATGRYSNSQICEEYQEPDYYGYYYNAKYQKAKFDYEGDTLSINLPQTIKANKSGSFFVYFRAFGYAKKNLFGAYKFKFETLKAEDSIRNLQVGISTDSDLVLRGAKGEVNYRFEEPELMGFAAGAAPAKSAAIDSFYSQIGQGVVTKTASNLSALESYSVDGAYASNRVKLYAKELLIALIILLFFALIFIAVAKVLIKKLGARGQAEVAVKKAGNEKVTPTQPVSLILATAGVGFISAFLIAVYTALVIFMGEKLNDIFNYSFQPVFILFLIIISFCVYTLFLFAPAIYIGAKKGIGWGVAALISTILWLIALFVIAVFIIFLLGGDSPTGPLRYLKGGGVNY